MGKKYAIALVYVRNSSKGVEVAQYICLITLDISALWESLNPEPVRAETEAIKLAKQEAEKQESLLGYVFHVANAIEVK